MIARAQQLRVVALLALLGAGIVTAASGCSLSPQPDFGAATGGVNTDGGNAGGTSAGGSFAETGGEGGEGGAR